ncbi:MAG: hypothetical protein PVJ64_05630 [Gemmatimonadales bacterium]|jgi:hypothetical protein
MRNARTIHRWITVALQVVMLGGLAFAVYERQWLNSFLIVSILCLTVLPVVLGKRFKFYIPPQFELLAILFVFGSVFLGEIRGYYVRFHWWDVALHTGSGFLLGILGFLLVYVLNEDEHIDLHMKPKFVALFSFAFAVAVGAIWEIFEYGMDTLFGLNMQKSGLVDTMWDLIVDSVGALAIALLGYRYMKRGTPYFAEHWIDSFIEGNPRIFTRHQEKRDSRD